MADLPLTAAEQAVQTDLVDLARELEASEAAATGGEVGDGRCETGPGDRSGQMAGVP